MSDEPVTITRDPAPYWSDEEVGVLTALSLAEVREDQGKPYSWHPLVPVGEYHHPKFGMLSFTQDDVADFAANFRAGVRGADIPVDEVGAHESTPGGAAYGWLEQVEARPDGLWGRIGWNKQGQEVLADDAYRYISPTLHTKALPFTARDGSKVGNVVRSICLTNRPVFKGQPALQVSMSEYEQASVDCAEWHGLSSEDIKTAIGAAMRGPTSPGGVVPTSGYCEALFDGYAVWHVDDGAFMVPFDVTPDGEVRVGEKVKARQHWVAASDEAQPEPEGEVNDMSDTPDEKTIEKLTQERDEALKAAEDAKSSGESTAADLKAAQDKIAELEDAIKAAETGDDEPDENAVKLAEATKRLQALEDERAIELSEREFGEAEFDGNRRLGKADTALYARVYRALPEGLAAQFAEHVKGGGASYVQFGEIGMVATGKTKPGAQKLYEDAVKADEDAALPEATVAAVVKFGEDTAFGSFDELYAAFAAAGKPGVK